MLQDAGIHADTCTAQVMKVGQTASNNKQACLAQGMTHLILFYTHVKTKQDPWNMMEGSFYGATWVRED